MGEGRGRGEGGGVGDLFMSWCSSLLLTSESGLARIPACHFNLRRNLLISVPHIRRRSLAVHPYASTEHRWRFELSVPSSLHKQVLSLSPEA